MVRLVTNAMAAAGLMSMPINPASIMAQNLDTQCEWGTHVGNSFSWALTSFV